MSQHFTYIRKTPGPSDQPGGTDHSERRRHRLSHRLGLCAGLPDGRQGRAGAHLPHPPHRSQPRLYPGVPRSLRDLHLCQGGQHGVSPDQEQHPGPYTFIFKATKEVPRRLMNEKKKTIGIRVPDNKIAQALLEALGEPLLSTTLILPESDMAEFDPEDLRQAGQTAGSGGQRRLSGRAAHYRGGLLRRRAGAAPAWCR